MFNCNGRFQWQSWMLKRSRPFGLGARSENGQCIVELCMSHNLFVTNSWFQQKKSAQHSWVSPDGKTKNQIDYILSDKRFRNGVRIVKRCLELIVVLIITR